MANISSSVGTNGANQTHDVALVQLMLKVLKTSSGTSYFAPPYTNKVGPDTSHAITAFQNERSIAKTKASETAGLVAPGSETWKQLQDAFAKADEQYRNLRTTRGVSIAYAPMPASALGEAEATLNAQKKLQADFKGKVAKLIRRCYEESQIAWMIVPQTGGFREFAGQDGLVSDAGYGESIHQYGLAVDLTVKDFAWVEPNLSIHKSAISFKGMTRQQQQEFFGARNVIATDVKLFSTIKQGDLFHVQGLDDATLDSVSSLMKLMNKVGPRKMKWEPKNMTPTDYWCDLGLGGKTYFVGTAKSIWESSKTKRISTKDLVDALRAKKQSDPGFTLAKFLGRTTGKTEISEASIGNAELEIVQQFLRAEFDAAAAKWQDWTPVTYPTSERRPKNTNP